MKPCMTALILVLAAPFAAAQDMDVVRDYRHGVYESIGGHMTAIVQIARNGYRTGDLAYHANAMAGLSKIAPELFPAGSGGGDTEALDVIWEKPDEFSQRQMDFQEAADGLAAVAGSGDMRQIGGALQKLGQSCKGCHDNFRKD